ncbi:hypothetical protein EW146_g8165 [Bondarzewia mesenterica]|uniref:Uncharacterized protein n=1 Tax=Bondarzewia mesenterica TaxID=1095465 RepID=A0A4S4LH63_9AGAM|nr:hypothetical protein EW146_g8165 [Bondarzewia mesenterica]
MTHPGYYNRQPSAPPPYRPTPSTQGWRTDERIGIASGSPPTHPGYGTIPDGDHHSRDKSGASHAAERARWDQEQQEHQLERERWQYEHKIHEEERRLELAQWQAEREAHKREREEYERERQEREHERQLHKPFWDDLQLVSSRCLSYNTREYTARLWNVLLGSDWLSACKSEPIDVHGRTLESPDRCEDWALEAPLWFLTPGDDWHEMCRTTPGFLPGIGRDLGQPNYCEQRVLNSNVFRLHGGAEIFHRAVEAVGWLGDGNSMTRTVNDTKVGKRGHGGDSSSRWD